MSHRIVLAVDNSKLGTRAQARVFDFEQVDLLVTDLSPTDTRLDPYRDQVEIA
jgi:DeoR/GlpR family transcriptional regulator of sugar metabolism